MKKIFDVTMLVFCFVAITAVACCIPRIFAVSGATCGWATVGLVALSYVGVVGMAHELRTRGVIHWT